MPDLIILRLYPVEPTSGDEFKNYLNDLTITVFDLSFADSVNGVKIGAASGLADPTDLTNNVNIKKTSIIQHYYVERDPLNQPIAHNLVSTATAVIAVKTPANHPEYPTKTSFDVRLEIKRGGINIPYRTLEYNVSVTNVGILSNNQEDYFFMAESAYVPLPSSTVGLDPNLAYVDLPTDGQPPRFDILVKAINLVLAKDPDNANADLEHLSSPLTPAQSHHVAAEIVWNRKLYKPPEPPNSRFLEEMYTINPPVPNLKDPDKVDQDRRQFEGQLSSYHATHDSETTHLAGFVFAAWAAVACEQMSSKAARAGLTFPIITNKSTAATIPDATVTLTDPVALNPPFTVPAEYFYAIGAKLPPQVSAQQRYDMARRETESQLVSEFQVAIDAGAIVVPAASPVNPNQAARRLRALGLTAGSLPDLPEVELKPPVTVIVQSWLDYSDTSENIDQIFWVPKILAQPAAYLELLLHVVTGNHQPLIDAIKGAPYNVDTADKLVAITDEQWRDFFLGKASPPAGTPPRINLLPAFTMPGTPAERVEAFIRHLRKFFAVQLVPRGPQSVTLGGTPTLGMSIADVFNQFTTAYNARSGGTFAFGTAWDTAAFQQALADVFPGDVEAQTWLQQALDTIDALYRMTDVVPSDPELQFSLMEALYARGFTDAQNVQDLSQAEFQEALTGTVAYPHAADIYVKAGATGPSVGPAKTGFKPINPDGSLTNCIPPLHLSPLGPVEYLHELLKVSKFSTCDNPIPEDVENTLADFIAKRRGLLGDLHATRANLGTPLPLIDLVNESLEALVAELPGALSGAVYDTSGNELAGHKLRTGDKQPGSGNSQAPFLHDPSTLFAALPEHSSPATPVAIPGAYDKLKSDFTSPLLPYSQSLDISRSYLRQLGTSRYAVMRRFRKDITEFVLDPAGEPAGFQRHLWRYPVRIEIAREYLGITPEEYDLLFTKDIALTPTLGQLLLWELYGFKSSTVGIGDTPWTQIIIKVSEFLKRTGLTYCEFIDLWHSEFVKFNRDGEDPNFPECEPCCLDKLLIQFVQPNNPNEALKRLAVFIHLWRKMQQVNGAKYTFTHLRDICEVLHLFTNGSINPDFIRQLAAFQMLRNDYRLALVDKTDLQTGGTGADRTHFLALWIGESARKWKWAVSYLLDQIEDYAEARDKGNRRSPELIKLLSENLDSLSRVTGFDPNLGTDTWHAVPTHTLRFTEVLTKIYMSDFGVGEILYLFTADDHLDGDDPFPLDDKDEALDSPLSLPDDEDEYSLWALRRKLLNVHISEEEAAAWTWMHIESSLRNEFGFTWSSGGPDPLDSLGEHFFPSILESCCSPVDLKQRQYRVNLVGTPPLMWNAPQDGPFRYDSTAQQLWTQIPLKDEAVDAKLGHIRQLLPDEQRAVQELYFLPRDDLAPFAFIFAHFMEADMHLIQEADEGKRWAYFQREFARFHMRCRIIAEHLAGHVAKVTGKTSDEGSTLAWRLLKHLFADENLAKTSWEDDSGKMPDVTWEPQPNGGAFAALLGLTGTGLLGELTPESGSLAWREVRGPMSAFGHENNKWNSPIPTVLPSMKLTFSPDEERFAALRNGFAMGAMDGARLGGAQGFDVSWSGLLLVEHEGEYEFRAGAPTHDGEVPNFEAAEHRRWRVTLKRGQKSWIILNHHWPGEKAPSAHSSPLTLKRGTYQLIVEFGQRQPSFIQSEDAYPQHTGFQVKYSGPDSSDRLVAIPLDRLFRDIKNGTLGDGISDETANLSDAAKNFLRLHFTSTLRDIRRTYQRVFKALLFASRFGLSAKPIVGDVQSEIGYMLDHGDEFLGTSYYRLSGGFSTHHAYFNFNLLPLKDPYHSPLLTQDQRVAPTAQRQQALFDWWERIFDYVIMRKETKKARERPAWRLFYEAAERQPDDPAQLLHNLGIDIRHAPLVLHYYQNYLITSPDMEDERWAVRVWQGDKWIRALLLHFVPKIIGQARTDLWASDDLNLEVPSFESGNKESGNENLTKFFRNGCIENGDPRRYEDIKRLNDGLRQRARTALLAYLCGMERVPLPWSVYAQEPRDLSDFLLQDVEAGICEKASRIEDAVSAVQTFVQRARLGLEPGFIASPAFVKLWDRHFAAFRIWGAYKRREIYCENWIEWSELHKAQKTEAFRFLESELRRSALTIPVPGGMEWWPNQQPPAYPSLITLQARELSEIKLFNPEPVPEGLGLLGTPERDARPSWLAPILYIANGGNGNGDTPIPTTPSSPESPPVEILSMVGDSAMPPAAVESLPLWIQAAIRLGSPFIRIAAAGVPPASTEFVPRNYFCSCCENNKSVPPVLTAFVPDNPAGERGCCADCNRVRPPFIDEYYFWLMDSSYFDEVSQDADKGAQSPDDPTVDATSDWHRPEKLPGLLHWDSGPMVHLFWCRVHNGEFQQPRRSDEGLRITVGVTPQLDFKGRGADSLRFEVTGGQPFSGYDPSASDHDPSLPGFRYDMATDSAVVLPLVVKPPDPVLTGFPKPLMAYPFFAYFAPGAHLEPPSPFSVSLTIAGTLRSHCRFEAALKWYELFFNPLKQDNTWAQCPNQDTTPPTNVDAEDSLITTDAAVSVDDSDNEPCCPSVPVICDVAKDRAVMLRYLETLLQWGDALMCRNLPEVFQQATVIFDTMKKILGLHPAMVLTQDDGKSLMTVSLFKPRPAPLNPRLMALYDREADRLALVHHCLNAYRLHNGRPNIDMPYWGNSPLRDGWKTTVHVCQDENDWCLSCCSPYRFSFLVQKALELAGEVRGFEAELLAAYEKGDAEYLASLRAIHEQRLLQLALEVRQNQWREADWQKQALGKTKEVNQANLRYYNSLIKNDLNVGEVQYEELTDIALSERTAGNVIEAVSEIMHLIPDLWVGFPCEETQLPIGSKLASMFMAISRILNTLADNANTTASLNLTQSGWQRRSDEWVHQTEVLTIEIEQIERQILAAERRRDIALRELNNHKQQLEQSIEEQNFLRDKFTSHELYLFLQQETAALHYRAYELALYTARQAQQAFNYERGYLSRKFLPDDAWDNLHEGLQVGERLHMAVRQMEKTYLDANCREYELTKHFSMRSHFPLAFLRLKATGYCEIEIPEWMFDLDYPGHYMRRIKNMTLTIPCVVGPYTGVHCRLTLLSSTTRIDPRLADPLSGCCDGCTKGDGYHALPDDTRIVKAYAATEAIATSSGQNDSGMFELNFHDERYLPFEFAGAVSRWRIELPPENNQFDFDTLSDIIMHLNYTAREGGDVLRKVVNECAQEHLPDSGIRFFDIRHDFPDAWQIFKGRVADEKPCRDLNLRLSRNMFPFLPGRCIISVHRLELFFEAPEAEPSKSHVIEFLVGHRNEHSKGEQHDFKVWSITCIASAEYPHLYHGVLDVHLGPLSEYEHHNFGTFKFPPDMGKISGAFLLCGYSVKKVESMRSIVKTKKCEEVHLD